MSSAPPDTAAFAGVPDLARSDLGGRAVWCSDDFFASVDNLVNPEAPVWDAERYTERGKWMDGWEPRRRRTPGQDVAIVRLGAPGDLVGCDIDTHHFLGNAPPFAMLDACVAPADASAELLRDHADWQPVLDEVPLRRGAHNLFALRAMRGATHVRLRITFPAGGVARLRVYAQPRPQPVKPGETVDLASVLQGARALACSDSFFSEMHNLLLPQRPTHMGQGWESKRSPVPREDWVLVALGQPGRIDRLVLDTAWFKGNFPTSARVEGLYWPGAPAHLLTHDTGSFSAPWAPVLRSVPLTADAEHALVPDDPGPWTHLRLTIESDGGVARLRAFGRPVPSMPGADDPLLVALNAASADAATEALARCCGAGRWARKMAAARPFTSRAHLHGEAERSWWSLGDADWLDAFTHHPRIGADVSALREKFAATADWSQGEQAGVAGASEETLQALAQGNADYDARFGHVFLICASGLSAETMLAALQRRLPNSPADELRIAAGEQAKITHLRLDKLAFTPPESP